MTSTLPRLTDDQISLLNTLADRLPGDTPVEASPIVRRLCAEALQTALAELVELRRDSEVTERALDLAQRRADRAEAELARLRSQLGQLLAA